MKESLITEYTPPRVLQEVLLQLELDFLDGSVVDKVNPVETAGQEVSDVYDYESTSSTLNHNWEH